jgi:hypothetical protein
MNSPTMLKPLRSWQIRHCDNLQYFLSLNKTEYPFFLLEQTNSGAIADPTAKDDQTGISSPMEEFPVSAPIAGKPEAADIQDKGKNGRQITFLDRQFFVLLPYDFGDVTFLKSQSGSYFNTTYGNCT